MTKKKSTGRSSYRAYKAMARSGELTWRQEKLAEEKAAREARKAEREAAAASARPADVIDKCGVVLREGQHVVFDFGRDRIPAVVLAVNNGPSHPVSVDVQAPERFERMLGTTRRCVWPWQVRVTAL